MPTTAAQKPEERTAVRTHGLGTSPPRRGHRLKPLLKCPAPNTSPLSFGELPHPSATACRALRPTDLRQVEVVRNELTSAISSGTAGSKRRPSVCLEGLSLRTAQTTLGLETLPLRMVRLRKERQERGHEAKPEDTPSSFQFPRGSNGLPTLFRETPPPSEHSCPRRGASGVFHCSSKQEP